MGWGQERNSQKVKKVVGRKIALSRRDCHREGREKWKPKMGKEDGGERIRDGGGDDC